MANYIIILIHSFTKLPWNDVREEMIQKGLTADIADSIGHYVTMKGGQELIEQLSQDTKLTAIGDADNALKEMGLLFQYCSILGTMDKVTVKRNSTIINTWIKN